MLVCRAKYLSLTHPDWKILIVCFNLSLCQYLRQLVSAGGENRFDRIQIMHYHGLVKVLTGANLEKLPGETGNDWDLRVGTLLREATAGGTVKQSFDAILVDEGQDFAAEWLLSLTALLNKEADSFLLCLDPAQNIFGRKITFKSVGLKVASKRPILLKQCYRNTIEILELARNFSGASADPAPSLLDQEEPLNGLLFPMATDRHGPRPRIVEACSTSEQIDFILAHIDLHLGAGDCSWCDIGVLYAVPSYEGFLTHFRADFVKRFGEDKFFWVSENRASKSSLDLTAQSVKVSTIESCKGLEFRVVFLVGLESLPRNGRSPDEERKLAYVGMTRAQDALYILGSQRTGFFEQLRSLAESAAIPDEPRRV